MVLQIMVDMLAFLGILAIALLGMASAFYAMLHRAAIPADDHTGDADDNPFRGPGHALFYMFNMLLLGDFDADTFVFGQYKEVVQVCRVKKAVINPILMLFYFAPRCCLCWAWCLR